MKNEGGKLEVYEAERESWCRRRELADAANAHAANTSSWGRRDSLVVKPQGGPRYFWIPSSSSEQ